MKGFWGILVLVALATAAFIYLTRPPKIEEKSLEESQTDGRLIARYWLDQAKKDQLDNMKKACVDSAMNQSELILKEIQKAEIALGLPFTEYALFTMGGGGALKAVLSGEEDGRSGILMQITLIMTEKEGKWYVSKITPE